MAKKNLVEGAMENEEIELSLNSRPMDYSEITDMSVEDLYHLGVSILGKMVFVDCVRGGPQHGEVLASWGQEGECEEIKRSYSGPISAERFLGEIYQKIRGLKPQNL